MVEMRDRIEMQMKEFIINLFPKGLFKNFVALALEYLQAWSVDEEMEIFEMYGGDHGLFGIDVN